jgi:hypothetical protein
MQRSIGDMRHATCSVQRATCDKQRATFNMRHATCRVRRSICDMRHAASACSTNSVQRATVVITRGRLRSPAARAARGAAAARHEQLIDAYEQRDARCISVCARALSRLCLRDRAWQQQLALHPGAHRRRSPGCAQQCALTRRRRRAPSAPRPTACQRLMAAATPHDRAACTAARPVPDGSRETNSGRRPPSSPRARRSPVHSRSFSRLERNPEIPGDVVDSRDSPSVRAYVCARTCVHV